MADKRVILAMSGGVDSSVAAYLLKEQGYEVIGVFLRLGPVEDGRPAPDEAETLAPITEAAEEGRPTCCSADAADDARRVAGRLGIPFYVLDGSEGFGAIIDYFAAEYARGRTPNPCVVCNRQLKFGKLMDYADALGAASVATGHYARIVAADGHAAIHRARDRAKDQSYALFGLPREVLSRVLLPIGELASKVEVREIARSLGLCVADKPDSQEICFVPGGDHTELLRRRAPEALRPGRIVDLAGRELGGHPGIGHFTLGQRRGLRISAAEPLYVVAIDAATATVTVGPRSATAGTHLLAERANWHADAGDAPFEATVQIRYNDRGAPAVVRRRGEDAFEADFHEPVHAITPGQVAAVYLGDRLIGGGWIRHAD